jgi:EAL domain-containing protein (putative c-di-GMP-specific phosphodiesterase class I)/CheY-like chemotaxis protein
MTENTPLPESSLCKIYIVDDDEQQANLMQAMAKTIQLKTEIYTSSIDFLNTPVTAHDIIILDLKMPEKDGIEIMRDLASRNIKPHFILVSGFDERVLHSAKQLAESKQLHVVSTLSKPFKAKEFIALIKQTRAECEEKCLQEKNAPSEIESEKATIEELKLAIRKHQLTVYFQPQICFDKGELQGAEILVRWQHPEKGLLLPEHFIPLAEKHQLMNLLTEEILMLSIKEYKKVIASELSIKIAINLSAQNVNDLSMPEKLEALVKSNNIDPELIVLEINESALMNKVSDSLDILNRLRMKGFSLSIDDFGTGHSSLVKLYQAPFTELKIDRHFILRSAVDEDARAIVRICILLAKELNMKTVAEGVETKEIWDQLLAMGCHVAQGDYIAKPMATEDFIDWVKSRP